MVEWEGLVKKAQEVWEKLDDEQIAGHFDVLRDDEGYVEEFAVVVEYDGKLYSFTCHRSGRCGMILLDDTGSAFSGWALREPAPEEVKEEILMRLEDVLKNAELEDLKDDLDTADSFIFEKLRLRGGGKMKMGIKRETAKAVLVRFDYFVLFRKERLPEGARVVDETERYALAAVPAETWLPKSQVKIENGHVVEVADWLRKDRGLYSLEEVLEAVKDTIEKIRAENPRLKINAFMVMNELPEELTHPNLKDVVRFCVEKLKEERE